MIETFALTYDDTPKSLNAGGAGSRAHWSKGHAEKRKWEGVWSMLLLERRVPRGMTHARVEAMLEFKHRNRRDVENYRPALSKALADALVKGGWLADDTDEFYELVACRIESGVELGTVKSRTTITLEAEYDR